jgi:chemotaxis protein CheC
MDDASLKNDLLKEIANIGLGHAATSLSKMVDAKVDISLPKMSIISIENLVGMKSKNICAVSTGISGDLHGLLLVVFSDNASFWLIDKISMQPMGTTKTYDDMGKEAMKEFVNIIGGSFLTSLSDFLKMDLMPKIPDILTGKGFDVKTAFSSIVKKEAKEVLSVKTELFINQEKVDGELYLVLDKESFEAIWKKMM